MVDSTIVEKANNLRSYLLSIAKSSNHLSVAPGKNAIFVYTKRKFKGYVPEVWEDTEVYHHHNGAAKITRLARDY